jgi:hypothetical protein
MTHDAPPASKILAKLSARAAVEYDSLALKGIIVGYIVREVRMLVIEHKIRKCNDKSVEIGVFA